MLLKRHASDNDAMSTGVYLPEQLFREVGVGVGVDERVVGV